MNTIITYEDFILEAFNKGFLLFYIGDKEMQNTGKKGLFVFVCSGINEVSRMAFINKSEIPYRVIINKDNGKFKAIKVLYNNIPASVRLNDNKTPYHWETRNFDSIQNLMNDEKVQIHLTELEKEGKLNFN